MSDRAWEFYARACRLLYAVGFLVYLLGTLTMYPRETIVGISLIVWAFVIVALAGIVVHFLDWVVYFGIPGIPKSFWKYLTGINH